MWLRLLKIRMLKREIGHTRAMIRDVGTYGRDWRPLLDDLRDFLAHQNRELERTRAKKDGVDDGQPL